jgi:hypothetical protein
VLNIVNATSSADIRRDELAAQLLRFMTYRYPLELGVPSIDIEWTDL